MQWLMSIIILIGIWSLIFTEIMSGRPTYLS